MTTHVTMNFRPIAFGPYAGNVEHRGDGTVLLRSTDLLKPYERRYTNPLVRWATERPQAAFLAKRVAGNDWIRLTYAEALATVRRLAQALLDRGLGPERPLMILSGNDLEFALLALAALHVGIPFAPVSPAYSLLSQDAAKVKHAVSLLTPGLVFAADGADYQRAIELALQPETELVLARGEVPGRAHTSFAEMLATEPTTAVEDANERVDGDTIAKFLFTSGSTKMPKAVINTHAMMCCNQQQYLQCYPFLQEEPPVLVDWLPWHHTAGGNNNLGLVLFHGGTLYIDDGKPTSDGMAETIRNLREISPTLYYTVPKGLEILVRAMRADTRLRENFLRRLRLIFPAGAALPGPLKDEIDAMAIQTVGARIPMTMALGMTETGPFAVSAHLPAWQAGMIGLPAPGMEVKLVPCGDKLEVRYRGPNVTPGYWRQAALTKEAFDEEGFFLSGDAARFVDDNAPEEGLCFDGRIAEDFKLASGTWVNVGSLRIDIIAEGAPYIQDVVLTGHDRDELGMLLFLLPTAAQLSPALAPDAPLAAIAQDPEVRIWAQSLLATLHARAKGSSERITRALLLPEPASMEAGEMTDKGSISQRAVLARRAALVDALYARTADARVLFAMGAKQ